MSSCGRSTGPCAACWKLSLTRPSKPNLFRQAANNHLFAYAKTPAAWPLSACPPWSMTNCVLFPSDISYSS